MKYTTDWTGCGGCDTAFPCHNGETRCIRLPAKSLGFIPYPLKSTIGKHTFTPYAVEFESPEGRFQYHIYAINDYHAVLQLHDVLSSSRIVGKVVSAKGR